MAAAAKKRPEIKVRFETFTALDRVKKAAKLEKRTVNQFVRIAAEDTAAKILTAERHSRAAKTLTTSKAEQLTDLSNPLSLNQ